MLVFQFAQAPTIQTCSSITQWHLSIPDAVWGHCSVSSAEGWMRHSPGCPRAVHALVTLQCQLTFLPASLGKELATAFLDRRQGWGKPAEANVLLPPCWPLGQASPLQGSHNLANWPAASSAWDFCLTWEITAPSCPGQVWCDVNVVLFFRSHVGVVENLFPFGLILPPLYLFS